MIVTETYILLGSNLGQREDYLKEACELIEADCGKLVAKSQIYETEPWGFDGESLFLNQVIQLQTRLNAENLLMRLLEIENILGRKRSSDEAYVSRTIDIDILYFGEFIFDTENLIVPHPRLHIRKFTLVPLVELIPEFIHPKLQISNAELLKQLDDQSDVKIFSTSLSG